MFFSVSADGRPSGGVGGVFKKVRLQPKSRSELKMHSLTRWTRAAVPELVGESAILYRPPYLIARGPKDDSPVNSRKLAIHWVFVKVAPRIS